ncbi:hypothetical protein NTHiID16_00970 [Haemophilus influenzae]|nr:hypothetical protein NTHiID16_00970 [Haemophilus influenzae]
MVLVTRQAPDFTSSAVLSNGEIVDNFNFKKHIAGKAAVIFFYPLDFTFVCPSELIAFDHRYEEFKKTWRRSSWCFYRLSIHSQCMA